jgi:four helix bundle protein
MWREGDVESIMESDITFPKPIVRRAKELVVFKRAYAFSLVLHKASLTFPKIEQFALADQLRRSSKSICANLVEGFSKQSQSKLEFKRFITIAIGSANETDLWINYTFDLGYVNESTFQDWIKENDAVIGMLVNLRNRL